MPIIIPLRELKNASKISIMCHENSEPVFVTKNGVSDLVILTSKQYDRLNNQNYILDKSNNSLKVNEPDLLTYIVQRDNKPLYSIAEIKQVLKPVFEKHKIRKAILFGSYVKGTADNRSDVDIMVDSDLTGLKFFSLISDVTDIMRFPVDLVAKQSIKKGSEFEKEIEDTGVTIYG